MKQYLWNLFVAGDQFVNTVLGGDPDETISSRLGKKLAGKRCRLCIFLCQMLNVIDPNHCKDAIEHDEGDDATWGI